MVIPLLNWISFQILGEKFLYFWCSSCCHSSGHDTLCNLSLIMNIASITFLSLEPRLERRNKAVKVNPWFVAFAHFHGVNNPTSADLQATDIMSLTEWGLGDRYTVSSSLMFNNDCLTISSQYPGKCNHWLSRANASWLQHVPGCVGCFSECWASPGSGCTAG